MEPDQPSYSLEDLAAETGFEVRVIRSFIEQGLLRGPSSLGRYARYSDWHLIRLLAIKALKDKGEYTHSDIRQALLCKSNAEIIALAENVKKLKESQRSSALAYIRSINLQNPINQQDQSMSMPVPARQSTANTSPQQSNSLNREQRLSGEQSQSQSQRQLPASEVWHRFQITPDVELSVRGIQTEQQMARLKSIANSLRELLIGGQDE